MMTRYDLMQVQEQGVETAKVYLRRAAQWLGGVIVTTAVRGGGGLGTDNKLFSTHCDKIYSPVNSLRNSYSLTDLSQSLEWSRGRFTDLTEEQQSVQEWMERSGGRAISCTL